MSHVFCASLASRLPTNFPGFGWFHVVCDSNAVAPCAVADNQETLVAGGGDVLWPGDCADIWCEDGVWVAGPSQGAVPKVSIELRQHRSSVTRDAVGVLQATSAAKLMAPPVEAQRPTDGQPGRLIPPGAWVNISGTIIGTFLIGMRARGGDIFVGTHMATTKPDGTPTTPNELPLTAGGATLLPQGQWMWFPGNHVWNAWTNDAGAVLEFWKIERGRNWGT